MARKGYITYKGMEIPLSQFLSIVERKVYEGKIEMGEKIAPADFLSKAEEKILNVREKRRRKRLANRKKSRIARRERHRKKMAEKKASPGRMQGKVRKNQFRKRN